MPSIFTRIINREIPANIVAEDDNYIALLDRFPLVKGHTLVLPKKEVDFIFDIDDQLLSGLMLFAKRISKAVEKAFPCKRIGVIVVGTEVPHAHIHLVPFNNESEMNIKSNRLNFTAEEMQTFTDKIRSFL